MATQTAGSFEGDRTLRVSTLAGAGGGAGGPDLGRRGAARSTARRHATTLITNADGVGRFPALSGVAAVAVTATSGAANATARLSLTRPTAALDLTLT